MQQPSLSCIQSRVENDNSLYGRFLVGPFRVGQGITVANALRRSLLSELTGLAITAIEIDGINHEYSTIRGVRESVLEILLNIKKIILTCTTQPEEPEIAYLQIHGPGVVLAKHIKFPISIQCINPEQYIAGLSFDGVLRIKLFICKGTNYKSSSNFDFSEQSFRQNGETLSFQDKYKDMKKKLNSEKIRKKVEVTNFLVSKKGEKNQIENILSATLPFDRQNLEIKSEQSFRQNKEEAEKYLKPLNYSTKHKLLPYNQLIKNGDNFEQFYKAEKEKRHLLNVNALFAPVKKVNFLLETDDELKESRDRIILEVWTNGSLLPREAIHYAGKALIELLTPFQFLISPFKKKFPDNSNKLENELKKSSRLVKQKNISSLDIANLELSLRSYTCLKRAGIETVGDLLKLSPKDLLLLKNFGKRSLDELKRTLNEIDISALHS